MLSSPSSSPRAFNKGDLSPIDALCSTVVVVKNVELDPPALIFARLRTEQERIVWQVGMVLPWSDGQEFYWQTVLEENELVQLFTRRDFSGMSPQNVIRQYADRFTEGYIEFENFKAPREGRSLRPFELVVNLEHKNRQIKIVLEPTSTPPISLADALAYAATNKRAVHRYEIQEQQRKLKEPEGTVEELLRKIQQLTEERDGYAKILAGKGALVRQVIPQAISQVEASRARASTSKPVKLVNIQDKLDQAKARQRDKFVDPGADSSDEE